MSVDYKPWRNQSYSEKLSGKLEFRYPYEIVHTETDDFGFKRHKSSEKLLTIYSGAFPFWPRR